ncbi:MAG: type I glyceraldehyde-3-phosphate dehydrogenase [Planctomycetes bacterium]|nr:type I glyceraldehyde-3-phosphate dehydrogenase [Planctomycetota bacterium]
MTIRIAINGFGRIGRNVFRVFHSSPKDFEVVALNDLAKPATLAHLLKYDSVFGRFKGKVEATETGLVVDGKPVRILSEKQPDKLPWKDLGVDFVVESTGVFTKKVDLEKHLGAGAKKVLLTVPAKDEIDATIVLGVNDRALKPEHRIISNASCTTNCVAQLAKVLHESFGIEAGLMTTVHAYTNDQRVLDLVHDDLRRARSAGVNIIPTTTGAAKAVGKVIPDLDGKLNGMAMRVPVQDGSITDLVCKLRAEPTEKEVNEAFRKASTGPQGRYLEYSEEPLVSQDVVGNPHSCVFDAKSTLRIKGALVKVIGWYDNEWAYSNRVAELIQLAHASR